MLPEERYDLIIKMLQRDKAVKVNQLMQIFDVSIETVRRDLEYLEKEGHLKKVYGGAVLEKVSNQEDNLSKREILNIDQKRYIASIAAGLVRESQSIIIDMGTTTLEFAKEVKKRINKLTVITNSVLIANELSDMQDYTIIISGGVLRKDEFSLSGYMTERLFEELHTDMVFLSAGGVSIDAGLTDYDIAEIRVKKMMIKSAQQKIVLADSSKFNVRTFLTVCGLNELNMIITDSGVKDHIIEKYQNEGVQVVNK